MIRRALRRLADWLIGRLGGVPEHERVSVTLTRCEYPIIRRVYSHRIRTDVFPHMRHGEWVERCVDEAKLLLAREIASDIAKEHAMSTVEGVDMGGRYVDVVCRVFLVEMQGKAGGR